MLATGMTSSKRVRYHNRLDFDKARLMGSINLPVVLPPNLWAVFNFNNKGTPEDLVRAAHLFRRKYEE